MPSYWWAREGWRCVLSFWRSGPWHWQMSCASLFVRQSAEIEYYCCWSFDVESRSSSTILNSLCFPIKNCGISILFLELCRLSNISMPFNCKVKNLIKFTFFFPSYFYLMSNNCKFLLLLYNPVYITLSRFWRYFSFYGTYTGIRIQYEALPDLWSTSFSSYFGW
jgi:hypothetical protein